MAAGPRDPGRAAEAWPERRRGCMARRPPTHGPVPPASAGAPGAPAPACGAAAPNAWPGPTGLRRRAGCPCPSVWLPWMPGPGPVPGSLAALEHRRATHLSLPSGRSLAPGEDPGRRSSRGESNGRLSSPGERRNGRQAAAAADRSRESPGRGRRGAGRRSGRRRRGSSSRPSSPGARISQAESARATGGRGCFHHVKTVTPRPLPGGAPPRAAPHPTPRAVPPRVAPPDRWALAETIAGEFAPGRGAAGPTGAEDRTPAASLADCRPATGSMRGTHRGRPSPGIRVAAAAPASGLQRSPAPARIASVAGSGSPR